MKHTTMDELGPCVVSLGSLHLLVRIQRNSMSRELHSTRSLSGTNAESMHLLRMTQFKGAFFSGVYSEPFCIDLSRGPQVTIFAAPMLDLVNKCLGTNRFNTKSDRNFLRILLHGHCMKISCNSTAFSKEILSLSILFLSRAIAPA